MRLTLPEHQVGSDEGFADDICGYEPFGERLANVVQKIDQSFVIALDGAWGSGKSTFIKQWAGFLRQKGAPVIEFDAFGNDHHDDAFLALSSEIYTLAAAELGSRADITQDYFKKAKATARVLLPIGARVAARAATAGLVGWDDIKEGGEAAKAAIESLGKEGERWVEKILSDQLRGAEEDRAALQAFRGTLSSLAKSLARKESVSAEVGVEAPDLSEGTNVCYFPLVVIIDELDRCRPPFALSLIERIKHLFLVEEVCFVLVTHLPQLESAIQGAYGSTFDAREYLEKFYHLRACLPRTKPESGTNREVFVHYLWAELDILNQDRRLGQEIKELVIRAVEAHELSLRSIERLVSLLVLVSASVSRGQLFVVPLVVGLCLLRLRNPRLYGQAISGKAKPGEVLSFLFGEASQNVEKDRIWQMARNWWSFAMGEFVEEQWRDSFEGRLAPFFLDHGDVLSVMAEYIESFSGARV